MGGIENIILEEYFIDDKIDAYYDYYSTKTGDINEHFPILKRYAEKCDIIYELGTRRIVSTWALLAGKPKKLVTVDIIQPEKYGGNLQKVYDICANEGIDFSFVLGNSLEIDIPKTDLLFIDTLHNYEQLSGELKRHSGKVKKYIIMHDTETNEDSSEITPGVIVGGLKRAIGEFLLVNDNWYIKEVYTNNNGLTILERKQIE